MTIPRPHQIEGARFLAARRHALLADAPRVGKTGAAIMAADMALDATVLVVTTASGRAVWRRAWPTWSAWPRTVQVLAGGPAVADVTIVGWPQVIDPAVRSTLLKRRWDRLILDESHYAKSFEAKRTVATYGQIIDGRLHSGQALVSRAAGTWCLTGTPVPNAPNDLYPMMAALCPERLATGDGVPDVRDPDDFLNRYCVTRPKKISRWRSIRVVMGGRNEDELARRLDGFVLRRTQQDVGITEPIYETLPLTISAAQRREIEADVDTRLVLRAADLGDTKALEMHLGPLRRLTGAIKAHAVAAALTEEFECGLDKVVLMRWHADVGATLRQRLGRYGVVSIDGSTSARDREAAVRRFNEDPRIRVFDAQIQAAGEAIDLSAAAEMIFVESSFVPSQMAQASMRISNLTQARQTRVRVAVLENSIDEAVETVLLRKWTTIRRIVK